MAEQGRSRNEKGHNKQYSGGSSGLSWTNPYPWMSSIEAMVQLALEDHKVPFSWRGFDGSAPTFQQLMGVSSGFQPEFTLKEYNTVVMVTSAFWGTLPGVLDKVALATVCFESDGWKVVNLFDSDIRTQGAWNLLVAQIPNLGTIQGVQRPNPYGHPDQLAGLHHQHGNRLTNPALVERHVVRGNRNGRRRIRRGGSGRTSDTGRRRIGVSGAVSGRYKAR